MFCFFKNSIDVILRAEIVETVQGGDQYDFTGTLVAVPDVGVLSLPGERVQLKSRNKVGTDGVTEGTKGLKSLGVRNLNYRLAFLACSAVPANPRVNIFSVCIYYFFLIILFIYVTLKTF